MEQPVRGREQLRGEQCSSIMSEGVQKHFYRVVQIAKS
jgi:hypothetical protein